MRPWLLHPSILSTQSVFDTWQNIVSISFKFIISYLLSHPLCQYFITLVPVVGFTSMAGLNHTKWFLTAYHFNFKYFTLLLTIPLHAAPLYPTLSAFSHQSMSWKLGILEGLLLSPQIKNKTTVHRANSSSIHLSSLKSLTTLHQLPFVVTLLLLWTKLKFSCALLPCSPFSDCSVTLLY